MVKEQTVSKDRIHDVKENRNSRDYSRQRQNWHDSKENRFKRLRKTENMKRADKQGNKRRIEGENKGNKIKYK